MHDGTFPTQNSALRANRTPFNSRSVGCGWHPGSADASAATSQSFATCSVVETVGVRRCGDLDRLVDMLLNRAAARRAPPLPKSAPEREKFFRPFPLHILPLRVPSFSAAATHCGGPPRWRRIMDYRARHKMYKGKGKGTGSQRSAVSSNGSSRVASHRTPRSKTPRKRAAASSSKTFLTLTPRVNDPDAEFFVTRIYQGEGMYKGAMRNAQREGLGAFFHINGNRYEGEWQADKAHGHGKMTYKDTSIYDGEWRLGHRHGKGTLTYASDGRAKSYKGQWEDDAQHGVGLFAWHGGESYEGAFVLGAMTGEGRLWFADGYVYHGPFVDGKRHGKGTTTTPDGSKEVAEWRKGKLVAKLVAGDWSSSWINVADEEDNAPAPTVAGSKNGQKLANAGSRNGLASLKSRFTILSAAQVEAALEVCEGDAIKAAKILEVARTAALIEKAKMAKQLQVAAHASWNSGEALLAAPQFGGASSLVMKPAAPRGARGPKPFAAVSADEYARLLEDPRMQHAAQAPARGAANNLPQPHIRVRRVLHSSQSAVSSKLAGARPKVRGAASAAAEEATKARASFIQEAQRDLRRVKKPNDGAAKAREERAVRRREAAASWAKERNEAGERMKEAAAQAKEEAKKAREAAAIVKPAAARSRDKLKADRTEFERQTIQPDAASACIIDEELEGIWSGDKTALLRARSMRRVYTPPNPDLA